ncbi:Guanine nucleotide exchange factor in Golgi transport [Novymonas esmeraldas]|uniref:Guanine nucleotide exchange factor in Golgi transport n=1 Tax=Novymonas esmeraldas TaxID=1808958 RepID=A0AAW0EZ45_9TRYP
MEKSVEEVVDACGRLLPEMKSGTRERSMVSAVNKTLKRRLQDARQPQQQQQQAQQQQRPSALSTPSKESRGAPVPQSSPAKPHPTGAETAAVSSEAVREAGRPTPLDGTRSATASPPPLASTYSLGTIQQLLCSDEDLSKLAYACRMAIVGESGGVARNSVRMLTAALELAAVVLSSGLLPSDLVAPVPTFAVPESTASGAQMFFSKLLGGKKSAPAANGATATEVGGGGAVASSPAEAAGPRENVRDCLVDAVLASVDMVQSKESSDRLYFVMIAALKAATAPRLSRVTSAAVQPSLLQPLQLSVHGSRLVRVFRVLLGLCARPAGLSPILVDEALKALHAITRALSKYVEQDAADAGAAGGIDVRLPDHTTAAAAAVAHSGTSSVIGTPLVPLPAAVISTPHGKSGVASFADPLPASTETDDGAAADDAATDTQPSTASSIVAAAAPSPALTRVRDRAETATSATAASPRRVSGTADMRLLLELCGHVVRLTPLSGISSMMAGSSGSSGGGGGGGGGVGADVSLPAQLDGDGNRDGAAYGGTGGGGGVAVDEAASTTTFPAALLNTSTLVTALSFLLYSIVNSGPSFRKSPEVVQLLRLIVVPAAIRTSISADLDVFRLSINVLLSCCLRFGPQMVSETGTVFRHVYFRVLDSSFTSLEHKLLVLDAFGSYIEEPQLLLGLFLNYDCNTHSQSIFEMMIHYLGALAMPAAQDVCNANLASELKRVLTVRLDYDVPEPLRRKALLSLLQVSDSNIQWIERFECDQEEESHASTPRRASTTAPAAAVEAAQRRSLTGALPAAHELSDDAARRGNAQAQPSGAEAGGLAMGGAGGTFGTAASVDTFMQARRYKDAFKKFLELFNQRASPEAAIDYLKSSVLLLGSAESPAGAAAALETPATAAARVADEDATAAKAAPGSGGGGDDGVSTAAAAAVTASDVDDAMLLSAQQVAAYLRRHEEYVDKMVLGDYFAKCFRRPSSRVVFEAWIELHDFTGKTLDEALRLFLGGFKLLGEAQVVDKTMELFAAQYCRQNPGIFGSADTAFILSFSICMLNTDAHSPHIKHKMTREGFLGNNKGIDEGNNIDPAILGGIYDRITREEIVLRPSPKCSTQLSMHASSAAAGGGAARDGGRRGSRLTTNLLDSIPLLRHLSPIAAAITDKVLLPMDAAGNMLFNSAQRKREEMYQQELRATLKEVMDALQVASASDAAHHAMFVTATSIENALPMWEVTVDVVCHLVVLALQQLLEESERYIRPQSSSTPSPSFAGGEREGGAEEESVTAYMEDTQSTGYFGAVLLGLQNTVRVCCAFGNVSHTEQLLEHMFELTRLTSAVVVAAVPTPHVTVQSTIPTTRLQVLSTFFNLFVQCGSSFDARGWQTAYRAMSLVDALANGVEGMWRRRTRRLLSSAVPAGRETGVVLPPAPAPTSAARTTAATTTSGAAAAATSAEAAGAAAAAAATAAGVSEPRPQVDLWFGLLSDVPSSLIDRPSRDNRKTILAALRSIPASRVDLWLEHLFDATRYPPRVQLEMANGLVKVCEMELRYTRTFSLTKLFDFVSVCASFSSRLQWRDLWTHASAVFTLACCRSSNDIALSSLDGLRVVALTYLMREELLNYSFQKEVLKPFESILMQNQSVACRQRVITILSEVIDFRAAHLASGWNVVFSCLSHAAAIPDVAPSAWSICEGVMLRHIDYVKDCFSDLIFCLTTFACSGVEESMPLRAISYLVACGHWLQYGLEAPPLDARTADAITRWATRFSSAEQELAASHTLGRHLSRVSLAAEPLARNALLQKPTTFTSKTKYHLWMSLFEGMVPIVVVHSSVRVRGHALSSIWALFAQYASLFDAEVRSSLFGGMVRPMLTTLLTHVPGDVDATSPAMPGGAEFDRFDYRLLLYFALKGMLLACKDHAHLLELACHVLADIVGSTTITLRMLRNDYVDMVLRVCYDFVWAAPSLATVDALSDLAGGGVGAASTEEPVNYAERLYQWIPAAARHGNPFVVGLVHEIQQVGIVDVVRFKRTAGWTELHQAPAARNTPVYVSFASIAATSSESGPAALPLIRTTVYACLTSGLLGKLQRLLSTCEADRDVCLEVVAAMRHVLLGVSLYYLVTRDASAVRFLKATMATPQDPVAPESRDAVTPAAPPTDAGRSGAPAGDRTALTCLPTAASDVLEMLLLIPYACVLLEFVAAFDLGVTDNGVVRDDLSAYVVQYITDLRRSREACVELQRAVQARVRAELEAIASAAGTTPGKRVYKEYKGCNFSDVFRSARYPIASRSRYLTAQTDPSIRQRIFTEWRYLLRIYALKCTAILGASSVVLRACPTRELIDLARLIPSAMEEASVGVYLSSCWEEMDLHCSMPPEPCVDLCASILEARL